MIFNKMAKRHVELEKSEVIIAPKQATGKIATPRQANDLKQDVFVREAPFTNWRELLLKEDQSPIIVETSLWKQGNSEYDSFNHFCEEQNIKIIPEKNINTNDHPMVLFDDPMFMSPLWKKGYSVKVIKGRSLVELLEAANLFTLIILSIKDDGSQALNHKWQEELGKCGIKLLTREYLRSSYLNVVWKKSEHEYCSLYEDVADEPLAKNFKSGDKINGYKIPLDLELRSEGQNCGNHSSIKIDGQEFSPNLRGMNMVVYDLIESKVEEIHRVDTFVSIYEDTTIYSAYLEEENHAS
jgi:hypothetical protein